MKIVYLTSCLAFASASTSTSSAAVVLETDLATISRLWGQISTYADNNANYFGVKNVGLPNGCQIEQAHLLQRHGQRFPTGMNTRP